MIRRKKPSRKQLVDAIYIMVRCWDRSKDHDDLAAQFGAHVEDLRDMVRHEHIKPVRKTIRVTGPFATLTDSTGTRIVGGRLTFDAKNGGTECPS
jgi:hypothetical protein